MKHIHHIFAATDLSEPSLHAVDRGFALARITSAQFTVMHALGLDALGPLRDLIGEQAGEVAHKAVQHQREVLEAITSDPARHQGVSAHIQIEEGLATMVVPAYASATESDLVIVGARGESTLRRLLLGSTASRLLRKSKCPVLVVKTPGRTPYRRVLIPIDFSRGSRWSIDIACELAPGADLVLMHVFDVPFEGMLQYAGVSQDVIYQYRIEARERSLRQLHQLAAQAGLSREQYTPLVDYGDAVQLILSQQAHYGCDLLVMGKHGTHVTEELLLGSVTKRVLSETEVDVLVVVDGREALVTAQA